MYELIDGGFVYRVAGEVLRVETWGRHAVRVRAAADARSRPVYLPQGVVWTGAATGSIHRGGVTPHVAAPLERIPVFIRAGAQVTEAFVS